MIRRRYMLISVWVLVVAALVVACAKAPYTHRSQLMLIPQSTELRLSEQTEQEILKKEKLCTDAKYLDPVKAVGQRIAQVSDRPDFHWEFSVIDNAETVNAFCLPGGKVYVYTGLFQVAQGDAQLAAVIGHEAGHAIARHGAERMSISLAAQVGQKAAELAVGAYSPAAQQAFATAFGLGATYGVILPFSREQEYEADRIGLILMAKAGYDPAAALEFWEHMAARQGKEKKVPDYLSTHPADEKRIAAIRRLLPEARRHFVPRS